MSIFDDEYISIQLHRWEKEIITKTKCNPGVSFYNAEESLVLCRIVLNKYTAKYLIIIYPSVHELSSFNRVWIKVRERNIKRNTVFATILAIVSVPARVKVWKCIRFPKHLSVSHLLTWRWLNLFRQTSAYTEN